MNQVKAYCEEIITSKNNLNRLNDLLKLALSNEETEQVEAIKGLRKVFKLLISGKKLIEFSKLDSLESKVLNEDMAQFEEFISKKMSAFSQILKTNIFSSSSSDNVKEVSIRVYLELSRYHFESVKEENWKKYTEEILFSELVETILNKLADFDDTLFVLIEYIQNYPDFSISFLNKLTSLLKPIPAVEVDKIQLFINFLQYIPAIDNLEFNALFLRIDSSKKKIDLINGKKQNKKKSDSNNDEQNNEDQEIDGETFIKEWKESFSQFIFTLAFKLKKPSADQQQLLHFIQDFSKYIFHKMEDPLLLANFLVEVFDSANNFDLQIISLSQLFILIGKHQLEYPHYYKKLFSMIDQNCLSKQQCSSIFLTSHTPKFLKLLETSLKTSKLSHKILAAFLRKILRTALVHPPNIILWSISLTINILKKNPTLVNMVDTTELKEKVQDCYKSDEKDFDDCSANGSFLWELKTLRNHYLNEVEKMVKVLGTKLDVAQFLELDSFSDIQYDHFIQLYIEAAKKKQVTFPIYTPLPEKQKIILIPTDIFE